MRATLMYGAGDVRVENVPDSILELPTDALVRVTAACVCGSDLWPYGAMVSGSGPARMGHEFVGVVEATGSEVSAVSKGDLVIAPWLISDGTCEFCRAGLYSNCEHVSMWDLLPDEGGQAEAVRVPFADGTLVKIPGTVDAALMPSLLTLSDVFGLLAALSAKRLGAERIILMGRHQARADLGREFGVTDVVAARGQEGIEAVRAFTGGHGAPTVIEAVGTRTAYDQAVGVVRGGGTISRVGVPQYEEAPVGIGSLFFRNIKLVGGAAPTRAYIEELMPEILDGRLEPGKVFDATTDLDGVPDGYRDMADRTSLKVLVTP